MSDVPPPDRSELTAAALAALAEAGILWLPAHQLLTEMRAVRVAPSASAAAFAVAYVVAVALVLWLRASRAAPLAVAGGAALGGAWLASEGLAGALVGIVLGLLLALRAITLALRDWREPIHASIGVGTVVLGIEALLSTGAVPAWRTPLLAIVPLFYVGSLGSRVATVWAADDDPRSARSAWIGRAALATVAFGAAVAAAALLAVRGGALERIGSWLAPVGAVALSVFVAVVGVIARPILWALNVLGVDPDAVRRALEEWRRRLDAAGAAEAVDRPVATWPSRVVGLLVFLAIVWLLVRSIRRLRARVGAYEAVDRRPGGRRDVPLERLETVPTGVLRFRRGLPSETVRRWYAEALIALEGRGLPKDPALTPAEFAPRVAEAFPAVGTGFRHLTRMYEDVRYGGRRVSGDVVNTVEPEIRRVLGTLRRED